MKHLKKLSALLLVLAMVLSCVGTAFAAEGTPALSGKPVIAENGGFKDQASKKSPEVLKGFRSETFMKENSYTYADDELVRAIVVLEGLTESEVGEAGSTKAADQKVKLLNQHNAVRRAMSGIDYTLQYEYTAVLNGFSCDVAYGDLDAIAAVEGVEAVYIANRYAEPVLTYNADTKMNISNQMTGASYAFDEEFCGGGIVIAVLDTGIRTTHAAFADGGDLCADAAVLDESAVENVTTPGTFVSAKIPFAYDYADKDADATDHNGHGTHVAGIAAGWDGEYLVEEGGYAASFMGAAPGAQLLAMKIFSDAGGGTSSDVYYQAIEDAYLLGADIISMSIGAQNGFTYDSSLETEVFGNIYKRMEEAGVVMSVAAGNEYSMAYYSSMGYIGTEYPDFGTVATPATYEGNVSVASMENAAYPSYYTMTVDGTAFEYYDSTDTAEDLWRSSFAGQTLDFACVLDREANLSMGYAEDFAENDVSGKIAIVERGDLSFEEKVENAANAGAIGCIVVNNEEGLIYMSIETYEIPAVTATMKTGELLVALDSGKLTVSDKRSVVESPSAWLMSEFSNWGTTPMLTIDPSITNVGGMIYSAYVTGDNDYEVMSGTSMATPNMSGAFADVLSFLDFWGSYDGEDFGTLTKAERAKVAKDLLHSTAMILTDANGMPYSVRKQGAGMAAVDYALDYYAYSSYISDPLKELGDDPEKTGVYSFDVTFQSNTGWDTIYSNIKPVVLFDAPAQAEGVVVNSLSSQLAQCDVTVTQNGKEITQVTVPAGGSATVTVTVTLSADMKALFDAYYPNGSYVEGYVTFEEVDEEDGSVFSAVHATFLAFYGDWNQAPVLEEADFRDLLKYLAGQENDLSFYTNPNMAFTLNQEQQALVNYLGGNLFADAPFKDEYISLTTPYSNGSFYWADAIYMTPYQLRNAEHLIMTVTNKETGEVYYVDDTQYLPKAGYDTIEGAWYNYGLYIWDGTDASGKYLPNGTVATITYDAVLPYGGTQKNVWTYDVTIDTQAPVIEEWSYDEANATLTVTASDDRYLQAIYLMSPDYGTVYDAVAFAPETEGERCTATFDLTKLLAQGMDSFFITPVDYATNECEEFAYVGSGTVTPVQVTLSTPTGNQVLNGYSGDVLQFPDYTQEFEGYIFVGWSENPAARVTDTEELGEVYYAGDELEIFGDVTFYALFAKGEITELSVANYYAYQASDYTGDWAIVGLNANAAGTGYDYYHPQALSAGAAKVDVASLPNTTIDDYYVQFFTNATEIRWSFVPMGQGTYVIVNSASGEYLALSGNIITTVETPDTTALWTVSADPYFSLGTLIYNVAQPKMLLTYDHWNGSFAVFDDTVPVSGYYYPSTYYALLLYYCEDAEIDVEYYTSFPGTEDDCHHLNTEVKNAVEATCTEDGYSGDTYCTDCGALVTEGKVIPAMGHDFVDGVCIRCGESEEAGECYFDDFSDCVAPWYHEAVDFTVANGLMNGMGDGLFGPNTALSRAMVVTVLYREAGSPAVSEPSTFTDVPEGIWYSDAIAWAQDNGIVNGVTTTEFAPDQNVTREQIATILWRYAGSPLAEADLSVFGDAASISPYAANAIHWAVSNGIMNGDGENLNPLNSATRAEFACMIMRYLGGSYDCEN
ncbi:MAG: S8 family serine peptidase [Oscillospiraceae bacterium]|nr:S8 family serine peptidase [Oscillospiraceae bacterium]